MHLDPELVQRLLHGQFSESGPAESAARAHLAGCADCRARLDAARREEGEVFGLLRAVDHAPPPLAADALLARRGTVTPTPGMRWAAGALLALGLAGAAYAMPGSPVRTWVARVTGRLTVRVAPAPAAPDAAPYESPALAGIAIVPGARLRIVFTSYQAAGEVQVTLSDSAEVSASAPPGAATFTTDGDRLVVANDEATATFQVRIPRAAPWVEIHVGGSRVFLKRGPDITTAQPAAPSGTWTIPMRRPAR